MTPLRSSFQNFQREPPFFFTWEFPLEDSCFLLFWRPLQIWCSVVKMSKLAQLHQNLSVQTCTNLFLMQQEVLRVINVVIVRILDPNPPRFRRGSMNLIVPLKLGLDCQAHSKNSPRDWLNAGSQWYRRNLLDAVLHRSAHAWVFDHVTWNSQTRDTEWKVEYSRTSTSGKLSTTLVRLNRPHNMFNLIFNSLTLQRPTLHNSLSIRTAKITYQKWPVNQRLTNGVYKTPFFIAKGHQTWSVPGNIGLCFCLGSVLLSYFDCVTYSLHANARIFKKRNV